MSSDKGTGTFFDERGLITRIYVENFVTYDRVEIRPARHLNLIIGPNGTGKSTIVCAIILGLGGKPKLAGRAPNATDYIKQGCQEAKIEIEFKDTNNKSIVITRCFNQENKSTWMLNGKSSQSKDIQTIIKSMNIQIDNLCQFLPQDKVQEFSNMNAQQLLENTERSAGDPRMVEYHTQLKEYSKRAKELEDAIVKKSRLVETESQRYEGMKEIVGNIKETRIIKSKIKLLSQKRAWVCYDQSRKQLCEAKIGRDRAAAEMKKLDDQLKPIKEIISRLESDIKNLKRNFEKHSLELSDRTAKVNRSLEEIQIKRNKVREIEITCEHRIRAERDRDQKINSELQQKNKLDNDLQVMLNDVGTEETLMRAQQNIADEIEMAKCSAERLGTEIKASKAQAENCTEQIHRINTEVQAARDAATKRLELIKMRSPDVYQGVMWLRENLDKFTSKVYEPMLLNIDVKDSNFSKYVERILAVRDIMAFVCEDKADMSSLVKYLKDDQKLRINVVYSDPNRRVQTIPNIPLDNLRQYGFQDYLVNLFEAPETIKKYLVTMYNLQNIPIGTDAVDDYVDRLPSNLRLFFSRSNIHVVNISKYTGTKVIRSTGVRGNGMLSIIRDTRKVDGLTEKLERLKIKRNEILEATRQLEDVLKESNAKVHELRISKQKHYHNLQTIQSLKTGIKMFETKMRNLENERTSIEEIQAETTAQIQNVLKQQLKMYSQYNAQFSDCFKFITTNQQTTFELEAKKRIFATRMSESQNLRDKCEVAEKLYKKLEGELTPLRMETQKLYDLAMESTNHISPADKQFKPFHTAFAKLPFTIDEIDTELDEAQARVYCLGENADAEQILQKYEKAQTNLTRLTEEIEEIKAEQTTTKQNIEETRLMWLTPLKELVDRINTNFSTYFHMLGCAGEVVLKEGNDINDFDQYGLQIRVKFRDADELQELTRQRQSGGERAVTTAVYMIALQELSRVPFRCVDEINQGMDAINERRIFELIVKITGRPNSSQYFLLTPKLLPNLVYSETVTVHCVFNGTAMVPYTEFDTASYCKKIVENMATQKVSSR